MAISVSVNDGGSVDVTVTGGANTRLIDTVTTQTSAYTAGNFDCVLADASGGAFSVTLPAAASNVHVIVKKTDSSANAVTIATPNSETIDGQASIGVTAQYSARTIVSDGTNYFIV